MTSTRYDRLLKRRVPEEDRRTKSIRESFELQPGEWTKYILGAIKQVDKSYTDRLIEQGNRVENQLEKKIRTNYPRIEYRRQGSVSNNTHIKYSSDVDLLVIIDKFHSLEHPLQPQTPYSGNANQDLLDLRAECKAILGLAFPEVKIDDTGSTAIGLSEGSLICPVDVVPSNWLNTVEFMRTNQEHDRGIEVFNKNEGARKSNHPFKFNKLLNEKDLAKRGLIRMMIRLIKTLKSDMEEDGTDLPLSSFDICSIIYRAPDAILVPQINQPFLIAEKCAYWLEISATDLQISSTYKAIDDSRLIYDQENKKRASKELSKELLRIIGLAKSEQGQKEYITEAHYMV